MVLRLWPFSFGIGRIARLIGLPAPVPRLVTRRLRGFPLRLRFNPHSRQGRYLYYRGLYEELLILTLRRLLRPGMTFVDVGANIGLYSIVAGYCVGPTGKVIAFEPQQGLADLFWENVRMNSLGNIIHEPIALGRIAGTSNLFQVTDTDVQATLRLRPEERSVGEVVVVPVRRLSDVLRERKIPSVDGVKIDVEGGELEVLAGFEDWMVEAPPRFMFLECIDSLLRRFGHRSHDLVDFLRDRGYTVYQPWRGRWVPIPIRASRLPKDLLALHRGLIAQRAGGKATLEADV